MKHQMDIFHTVELSILKCGNHHLSVNNKLENSQEQWSNGTEISASGNSYSSSIINVPQGVTIVCTIDAYGSARR